MHYSTLYGDSLDGEIYSFFRIIREQFIETGRCVYYNNYRKGTQRATKTMMILFALIMCFFATSVYGEEIYTYQTQDYAPGGVVIKNIKRFYNDYSLDINCITADLKNENLRRVIKVLIRQIHCLILQSNRKM